MLSQLKSNVAGKQVEGRSDAHRGKQLKNGTREAMESLPRTGVFRVGRTEI